LEEIGWNGSDPNKSWAPFVVLLDEAIFGGGATKININ
jgi:hypothetical protein